MVKFGRSDCIIELYVRKNPLLLKILGCLDSLISTFYCNNITNTTWHLLPLRMER